MEVSIKEAAENLDKLSEMLIKGTVKEVVITIWGDKSVVMKRYEIIKDLEDYSVSDLIEEEVVAQATV